MSELQHISLLVCLTSAWLAKASLEKHHRFNIFLHSVSVPGPPLHARFSSNEKGKEFYS